MKRWCAGGGAFGAAQAVHLWTMRFAHRPACRGQRIRVAHRAGLRPQAPQPPTTINEPVSQLWSYRGDKYSDAGGPLNGQRRYPAELTKHVRFIKRAQVLGFTLEEIAGLLRLEEACACAETRELADRKLQVIDSKLADLNAMRKALAKLVRQCDAPDSKRRCPIIHALTAD